VPELTVASYNIHWGYGPKRDGLRPFDVVAAARELDADVLVLQESWASDDGTSDHQRIADALDMRVVCDASLARSVLEPEPRVVGPPHATTGDGSWHLVALARVPVTASRIEPLPHLWSDTAERAVLAFTVAVDGMALEVCATHLPHLEYGSHLSARGLRRALPPVDRPAVFIGDMNMWGWTLDVMLPRGWRRAVHGKTWPSHRPHSQIDHLLVTPSVEVVSGRVGPDLGSDHLPIRGRLRW
jgi:endonuclease/exonuclease/phosphatase family metal-dependent hydrolase